MNFFKNLIKPSAPKPPPPSLVPVPAQQPKITGLTAAQALLKKIAAVIAADSSVSTTNKALVKKAVQSI